MNAGGLSKEKSCSGWGMTSALGVSTFNVQMGLDSQLVGLPFTQVTFPHLNSVLFH